MESCPDCFKDQRSINEKLQQVIKKATDYAEKQKKTVVIYPTQGDFEFIEEHAYSGTFTMRISPKDSNITAEQV